MIYLIFIPLFLLTACTQPTAHIPPSSQAEIKAEAARQVAAAAEAKLERQEALMQEHLAMQERLVRVALPVSRAGAKVCQYLVNNAGICVYEFELSKEKGVNARTDGKKVQVNLAMMRFIKSDDELAVVLGHELAHNIMGHVDAKRKNAYAGMVLGAMVDAVVASQGIKTASAFSKEGAKMGGMAYSPNFEKEADYVGLYITALAGYDSIVAPEFWRRMAIREPDMIVLSTTHPTTPERTVMIEKTIREIEEKQARGIVLMPHVTPGSVTASGGTTILPLNPYKMAVE